MKQSSFLLLFTWRQVLILEAASPLFIDPVQRVEKNKKKKTGSKSNNSRCSISVSVRYASFQVLLSLCEIDSQRVENLCPCWHCCADTCCGLRCPWKPEELPPPLLLTEPISTPCSFVSSLFVLQNTYLAHSVQAWLCGFHNEMPRKFLHIVWELFLLLLATFWQVCAAEVQQKFFSSHLLMVVPLSCVFYVPRLYALVASFHVQGVRLSFSFIGCDWIKEEFSWKEKLLSDGCRLIKSVCRSTPQLKILLVQDRLRCKYQLFILHGTLSLYCWACHRY